MNRILTAFAALLTVGALLCTLASCGSSSEGDEAEVFSTEAAVYTTGAAAVGSSDEDVLAYFNKLANSIKDQKPAVEYRIEKSIPTDSLRVTKRGAEDAAEPDESTPPPACATSCLRISSVPAVPSPMATRMKICCSSRAKRGCPA